MVARLLSFFFGRLEGLLFKGPLLVLGRVPSRKNPVHIAGKNGAFELMLLLESCKKHNEAWKGIPELGQYIIFYVQFFTGGV